MNALWYRRLLPVVLTILLTLTLYTPALAAKPEFIIIPVDDTFVSGECDGFSIIEHVEGRIKISVHFDKDGNFAMQVVRVHLRHTLSNSETGASLSTPDVGIDKITVHKDGSTTVAIIGVVARIVVPGEGLVFARIGRVVFDANTGETIFEAGQQDDFANLIPVLCSALD
jgi:hypothetical protein